MQELIKKELTYVAEQNGQEYEAMRQAEDKNAKIHTKVEHLKQLWVRKGQHTYAHYALKHTAEHLKLN